MLISAMMSCVLLYDRNTYSYIRHWKWNYYVFILFIKVNTILLINRYHRHRHVLWFIYMCSVRVQVHIRKVICSVHTCIFQPLHPLYSTLLFLSPFLSFPFLSLSVLITSYILPCYLYIPHQHVYFHFSHTFFTVLSPFLPLPLPLLHTPFPFCHPPSPFIAFYKS